MMNRLPTAKLNDVLSGRTAWEDADASIQSWARLSVHQAAMDVLKLPQKERRTMLDEFPDFVRPKVEAEVIRVWEWKRSQAQA